MGKSKTTKFKRSQFNSIGLPVNAVKEVDVEEEDQGDGSPAAELLEKVRTQSKHVYSLTPAVVIASSTFYYCNVISSKILIREIIESIVLNQVLRINV